MRKAAALLKCILCLMLALGCGLFARAVLASPVFEGGTGYELYLSDSAGEIRLTETPARDKLFLAVTGESVRYEGDLSQELMEKFAAKLVFCEKVGQTVNYYLYSPKLGEGIALPEGAVNLHIAVRGNVTAAGTPLIFGGF